MSLECVDFLTRGRVPNLQRVVQASRDHPRAVGAEGHARYPASMSIKGDVAAPKVAIAIVPLEVVAIFR